MGAGKLSYEVVSKGKREKRLIDVAELVRVFGPEDEQDLPESEKKVTYPQDQVSILLTERLNDMKSELDYLKKQLEEQKVSYEARIKWLERELESRADASEAIKDIQTSVVKLLEHQSDIKETSKPEVIVLPQQPEEKFEPVQHVEKEETKPEPKKKRGVLFRMLEAALD